eukprot:Em0018g794a
MRSHQRQLQVIRREKLFKKKIALIQSDDEVDVAVNSAATNDAFDDSEVLRESAASNDTYTFDDSEVLRESAARNDTFDDSEVLCKRFIEVSIATMRKSDRSKVDEVYVCGFVPSYLLPNKCPVSLDPFLEPLVTEVLDLLLMALRLIMLLRWQGFPLEKHLSGVCFYYGQEIIQHSLKYLDMDLISKQVIEERLEAVPWTSGEVYSHAADSSGDPMYHSYSDNPYVEPTSTVKVLRSTAILRKVMLYPDPDMLYNPSKYIVIDYLRPIIPLDKNVPHYPEEGDMISVKGIGSDVYLAHIQSADRIQKTCQVYFYERDTANISERKYKRSQMPPWLEDMISFPSWRDLFHQLAKQYPDCLMLKFTIKLIADTGYQGHPSSTTSTVSHLPDSFATVFKKTLKQISKCSSSALHEKLAELTQSVCHSQHTYFYLQAMLQSLSQGHGEVENFRIWLSQEMQNEVRKRKHDVTSITLHLNGMGSHDKLFEALTAMLSRGALNPADITILYRQFADDSGLEESKRPVATNLHIPRLLELLVQALFKPSSAINPDHKEKYLYILAYAVSVYNQEEGPNKEELEATKKAIETAHVICSRASDSHAELQVEVPTLFDCIRYPVVSMGVLLWVEHTLTDTTFFEVAAESSPLYLALLDEVRGLSCLAEEICALAKEIRALAGEICALAEEICALAGEICALAGEIHALAEEICALAEEICALAEEICALAGEICALAGEIRALAEEICALAEEICALAEEICALAEEIRALAEEICALAEEICALAGEICALAGEICAFAEEIRALAEEICALAEEICAFAEEICALAEEIPPLFPVPFSNLP